MTDFAFQTIPQLGRLLRDRKATAVELAEYFLDRLERLGPNYNAVVTVLREPALAEARERDAELGRGKDRGPLHGIPYGAKDLLAAAGAPTTWGAQPYRDQLPEEAPVQPECHPTALADDPGDEPAEREHDAERHQHARQQPVPAIGR